jgi:hypothetical protein
MPDGDEDTEPPEDMDTVRVNDDGGLNPGKANGLPMPFAGPPIVVKYKSIAGLLCTFEFAVNVPPPGVHCEL